MRRANGGSRQPWTNFVSLRSLGGRNRGLRFENLDLGLCFELGRLTRFFGSLQLCPYLRIELVNLFREFGFAVSVCLGTLGLELSHVGLHCSDVLIMNLVSHVGE